MLPTRFCQDTAPYVEISSFRHPMRIRYVSVENPYQAPFAAYVLWLGVKRRLRKVPISGVVGL